jgi:hypothetical protein
LELLFEKLREKTTSVDRRFENDAIGFFAVAVPWSKRAVLSRASRMSRLLKTPHDGEASTPTMPTT